MTNYVCIYSFPRFQRFYCFFFFCCFMIHMQIKLFIIHYKIMSNNLFNLSNLQKVPACTYTFFLTCIHTYLYEFTFVFAEVITFKNRLDVYHNISSIILFLFLYLLLLKTILNKSFIIIKLQKNKKKKINFSNFFSCYGVHENNKILNTKVLCCSKTDKISHIALLCCCFPTLKI